MQDLILSGGMDANAVVFDRLSGEIVSTLTGHSKRVCIELLSLNVLFSNNFLAFA